jgi:hypothetical protein
MVAAYSAGEIYILGHRLDLARVDVQAAGAAAMPADKRSPGHAAAADGTVDATLGDEISSFELLFHCEPLRSNKVSPIFNAGTCRFSTVLL